MNRRVRRLELVVGGMVLYYLLSFAYDLGQRMTLVQVLKGF